MSGTGEVIGTVVEGGLTARALEPAHGEAGDGHSHESACLNCGTALVGSHCHSCGQAAHVHKTLGAFFHDLLHGVFHFEGKIWRTLPLLAWKPGKLTREYIDGRRASYVSPIALFLFSVFLMFAVVKQFAGEFDPGNIVKINGKTVNAGMPLQQKRLADLKAQRAAQVARGQSTADLDGQIAGQEQALEIMNRVKDARFDESQVQSDIPAVDKALKEMKANPALVIYKLQNTAYKFSWALIPISVPFVWLLFPFSRRFGIYDHTVFVTYSLCFMTLLTVIFTLGVVVGAPGLAAVAMLVPPLHMYRQLRGTYGVGRIGAAWRTAVLLFVALTALILFALLILAETAA
ncbi:MAG: DUF3667 domain-containing protein [Novosphingobium sp.]